MAFTYEFKIGANQAGLVLLSTNLSQMNTVYWPEDEFTPASQRIENGAGGVADHGWPIVEWHWNVIPDVLVKVLRGICTSSSGDISIRTRTNETGVDGITPVWHDYDCTYIWPERVNKQAGRHLDFTLRFQALVELAP